MTINLEGKTAIVSGAARGIGREIACVLAEAAWDATMDVNLKGTFLMCRAVIEVMKKQLLDTLTLRRWGSKRDVANLVCFLASDLAAYDKAREEGLNWLSQ